MNDIENGEVKAERQHPRAENNNEWWDKRCMSVKPFQNPIAFE